MTPYLFAHQNPFAPRRANGLRFHGYPTRTKPVRVIVIHTAENTPDYVGEDGGAEAVARFQSTTDRPSSYHQLGDSDSVIEMLPDEAVAFGAKGANADGLHFSFATRASLWPGKPVEWRVGALVRGAAVCRTWATTYGIPVRRLTRDQWLAGESGFVAHADVDPGRRSDPGAGFPWDDFLTLVASPRPDPDRDRTPEDDVSPELEAIIRQAGVDAAYARKKATTAVAALGRIEKQLAGRDVADDLVRLRQDDRAVGKALGLAVDLNGEPGRDIIG